MAGSNAFAFTGSAFVPEDRQLTATLSVRTSPTSFSAVARAYNLTESGASQIWVGFPPEPTITGFVNNLTGSFPNRANSITVEWEVDESTLISGFDIFVAVGAGPSTKVTTVPLASNARSYEYGFIAADTTYTFIVRCLSISGLATNSDPDSFSLAAPAPPSNLRETSQTSSSITWSWDVTAGTYQSYEVQRSADNVTWLPAVAVSGTEIGTTFTSQWTGLLEHTTYYLRVRGRNYNGHWSAYTSSDAADTLNEPPSLGTISAAKVAVSSTWAGQTGTATSVNRSITVSVDPSNDPDFASISLYESTDGTTWNYASPVKTWTDNTDAKTETRTFSVSGSGVTRYYRTRQFDVFGAYVESSSVSATTDPRWSYSFDTKSEGTQTTVTVNGNNLNMLFADALNLDNSRSFKSPEGTYGWAKSYDSSAVSLWISDPLTTVNDPNECYWGFNIDAPSGQLFWRVRMNYYEYLVYDTNYQAFGQLYDDFNQKWHGTANEPTGCNGLKYVEYKSSHGNQSTYTRINTNITALFGSTGRNYIYWDCRLCFRNAEYESAYSQIMYGVLNFRVNYTYSYVVTTTTTYYW